MARNTALFVTELVSLVSCIGAFAVIGQKAPDRLALFYLSPWFISAACCNAAGLLSLAYYYGEDEDQITKAHDWLHRHYVLCWITIILGYPTLVTAFWLTYCPTPLAHAFFVFGSLPFLAWALEWPDVIPMVTKVCVSSLILLHVSVCVAAKNWFGVEGTFVMVANLVTLTIPTGRTTIFNISPREAFVGGLAVASVLYAQAIRQMYDNPTQLGCTFHDILQHLINLIIKFK